MKALEKVIIGYTRYISTLAVESKLPEQAAAELAAMQARIEAAEKLVERLRSIRTLAEEADARGEDVPSNGFFTDDDATALEAWEALK